MQTLETLARAQRSAEFLMEYLVLTSQQSKFYHLKGIAEKVKAQGE